MSYEAISDVRWVDPNIKVHFGEKRTNTKLSLLPRRCHYSKKNLWLKKAYRVRHIYFGYNDETHSEDRWYDKDSYLILRLNA